MDEKISKGIDDVFSMRLQQLREKKRISRVVASQLCGLSDDSFRKYERRESKPSIDAICAIADFFSVSIDFLIGREKK